ncbi:MAG: glycosyltransferase family 87 protein [Nocardioides sp.]
MALSEGIGGPIGTHATRHRWWTPTRVVILLAAACFCLGMVQKTPCFNDGWRDGNQYSDMCYSDLPFLYTGRGLAELAWPYSADEDTRARHQVMEYPVGIAYWAWGTAWVTHWLAGSPDVDPRFDVEPDSVWGMPGIQRETQLFVVVNAVGFALLTLLSAYLLTLVNPRRPWDGVFFAASPALALSGLINWDLLAVVLVAGALWSWSRSARSPAGPDRAEVGMAPGASRPAGAGWLVLTGALIGLGTAAKLYPLFLLGGLLVICLRDRRVFEFLQVTASAVVAWILANAPGYLSGPDQWHVFWTFNTDRGADLGSIWLAVNRAFDISFTPELINRWSWIFFIAWCGGVLLIGLLAPTTPRFAQLGFLIVAGFLLVNKVYSPQYVLWLLPLAALARPRWRDQLIWQSTEVFYFMAVWWYLGGFIAPASGGEPPLYWVAIMIRMLGECYLIGVVTRDILLADHDPVERGGGLPNADRDLLADHRYSRIVG